MPDEDTVRCGLHAAGSRIVASADGILGGAETVGARQEAHGNALSDAPTKFVVTMLCAPGQPMLRLVDEEELKERAHLRAPRPSEG